MGSAARLRSPDLTCYLMVTYSLPRGRGVQGARRLDAKGPARRALQAGRADAEHARATGADDALRRDEAPARARGGGSRDHPTARAREAALPEPGPDPAHPRPV